MTSHGSLAYIAHLWSKKCAIDDIQAHFSFDVVQQKYNIYVCVPTHNCDNVFIIYIAQ